MLLWGSHLHKVESKALKNNLFQKLFLQIEISAHTYNLVKSKNIIITTKLWLNEQAKAEGWLKKIWRKTEKKKKIFMNEVGLAFNILL